MSEHSYLRYPHIAGELVTFVAEDDVWLASPTARSGVLAARRLTDDGLAARQPRLNPSGDKVAWSSARGLGGPAYNPLHEAHVIGTDGSGYQQLTYWNDRRTAVCGWLSDEEVLVRGRHGHHGTSRTWMFGVVPGGSERELPYGPAADVAVNPAGAVLLGTPFHAEPAYWKHYRGGTAGKIWLAQDGVTFERILGSIDAHLVDPMWVGNRIAFLSDHEGAGAVYSTAPDGSDLRRHTDHGPFYARHAATDGTRIVYECAGQIWLLDSLQAPPRKLEIRLEGAGRGRSVHRVTAAEALDGHALDPTAEFAVIGVRGTVHLVPTDGGPGRTVLDAAVVRAHLSAVASGGTAVVCVTDEGGEEGLAHLPQDGSRARHFGLGESTHAVELVLSPDGHTAAVSAADGRVLTVALESGQTTELARGENGPCTGLAFSPDSSHLVWAQPWILHGRSRIRIARLADSRVVDVTSQRFDDFSPVFTLDGRYLAFLSNQTFDPDWDGQVFDFSFVRGIRPYLVPLSATAPSSFGARFGGVLKEPVPEQEDTDEQAPAVDLADMAERAVPFPVPAGYYSCLRAVENGVVWLDLPVGGVLGDASMYRRPEDAPQPTLVGYNLVDRRRFELATGLQSFSAAGSGVLFRQGDVLRLVDPRSPDGEPERVIRLGEIQASVDPDRQWRQMYDEAWRVMRDGYWLADMNGVDWPAMAERYRPWLDRIGSTDDLVDVLWELLGELSTSHTAVLTPRNGGGPARKQGFLGVQYGRTADGGWLIDRVLPGDFATRAGRSPLAGPGAAVRPGDRVLAVDGEPVAAASGPAPLLAGKGNRRVDLSLARGGRRFTATVIPTLSERRLRYLDLIATRGAKVHAASGGRIGYVHVPDLKEAGWADFHRDMRVEFEREGLILDLRENPGGGASQLVIEKLVRRVNGWYTPRHAEPYHIPFDVVRGPVVGLVDEFSCCGAEQIASALKLHGIGTVVGTRTWGGVNGEDDIATLVDGTLLHVPIKGFWMDGPGWGVENHGIEPDVDVEIAPHDWAAGRDPQLDTALEIALADLRAHPAATAPARPAPRR